MHLPGIYQPSKRLIFSIGNYYKQKRHIWLCRRLCWQMINMKLLKGNRLLDISPEEHGFATLLKKRPWNLCFPVNFVKFSWKLSSQSTSGRLLLWFIKCEILIVRNSHQRCSVKRVSRVSFLIKFQALAWNFNKKRDSGTVFFLWIL